MKNIIRFIIVGFLIVTALTRAADVAVIDIVSRAKSMPDGSRTVNVPSSVMTAIDKQTGNKYGQGVDFVNDGIEAASRTARAISSSSSSSAGRFECTYICRQSMFTYAGPKHTIYVDASSSDNAQSIIEDEAKQVCRNETSEGAWVSSLYCSKK